MVETLTQGSIKNMSVQNQAQLNTDWVGFLHKVEKTKQPNNALIVGSFNFYVNDEGNLALRPGYSLFGAAYSINKGIEGGDTWDTNTGTSIPWRTYNGNFEAYVYDVWTNVGSGYTKNKFRATTWWDATNLIDKLVMVNGTTSVFSWTGAYTKIASATATTITKMFYKSGTGISFTAGTLGSVSATINDTAAQFIVRGFAVGDYVQISGSASGTNDKVVLVKAVSAGTLSLALNETLTTQAAGPSVTISVENKGTYAQQRFISNPTYTAISTVYAATGKTITRASGSWITDGVVPGDKLRFSGTVSNNLTYTVATVTSATVIVVVETPVNETVSSNMVRQNPITVGGSTYYYEGGYDSDVLTGVTPSAAALTNGSVMFSGIVEIANKPASTTFRSDFVNVLTNQVYYGSYNSRYVYVSTQSDFTSITKTSPVRKPGEGETFTLDGYCSGFAPQEESMYMTANPSYWYNTKFTLSSDAQSETLTVVRLKSGAQQAAKINDFIFPIKDSIAFMTVQQALDTLGRIELIQTPQQKEMSDQIKFTMDALNITQGHGIYWDDKMWLTFPLSGVVLMYDLKQGKWTSPMNMSISRFFIYQGLLYGHSFFRNESYRMWTGYSDNEIPIYGKAILGYTNAGIRDKYKNWDTLFSEGYITPNGQVKLGVEWEINASRGSKQFSIIGAGDANTTIYKTQITHALGFSPLGEDPIGGTLEVETPLNKFRFINTARPVDTFEYTLTYEVLTSNTGFSIITNGANNSLSKTITTAIIR